MNKPVYVLSDSLDEMVLAYFIWHNHCYEWNDRDCVYYDITAGDESYLMVVPDDDISF